jgi:hypothetical protein
VHYPDVPMRKLNKCKNEIMAYRFQNGAANFEPPVLHYLRDMRNSFLNRKPKYQKKYKATIRFVEKHQRKITRD